MALSVTINGYYRSGTTLLWRYLRNAAPDLRVFYEPMHPRLSEELRHSQSGKTVNELHDARLWREYFEIDEQARSDLVYNTVSISDSGINWTREDLLEYLLRFDSESYGEQTAVQCNRAHCVLDVLQDRTGVSVVHIIRSPEQVAESMKRAALQNYGVVASAAHTISGYIYRDITTRFFIDEELGWAQKRYGVKELGIGGSWREKFLYSMAVAWSVYNFEAIRAVRECDGCVVTYHELVDDPNTVERRLESTTGLKLGGLSELIQSPSSGGDQTVRTKLNTAAKVAGVLDEWRLCTSVLEASAG